MEIGWTDVGSGGYILVSCAHSNTSLLQFNLLLCNHANQINLNMVCAVGGPLLLPELYPTDLSYIQDGYCC